MEEEEYGVEKISIVCDFSGADLTKIYAKYNMMLLDYGKRARSPDGMKVAKQSIHILQNHYPERLGRALIVNPPWFFHVLYKVKTISHEAALMNKKKFVDNFALVGSRYKIEGLLD